MMGSIRQLIKERRYPSVSCIISNFNGKELLKECLGSLLRQDYPGMYEIIVVDAGSVDGSPQMVSACFPKVKLIEAKKRIGISQAINIGLREANSELVGFDLNNDEVFSKDWLRTLVDVLLSDERIGVVGGTRLLYGTNGIIDDAGVITNTFGFDFKLGSRQKLSEISKKPREVDFTTTLLFRRDLLADVGFCDEEFYIYFEDAEFCERVRRRGYKILNVPQAVSNHRLSATLGKQSANALYFLRRGRIRFIIKHFSIMRMLVALAWWIFLQTAIDALMVIPFIRTMFSATRLNFLAKRGTKDNLISVIKAIIWNLENLQATIHARKEMNETIVSPHAKLSLNSKKATQKRPAIPLRLGVARGFTGVTSTLIKLSGYPNWNRQLEASLLFEKTDLRNVSLALEVGCGTAPLTAELSFRGIRMVGIDANRSVIAVAHRRYAKQAEFVVADASRLPFRPKIFEAVFALSAVEHFLNIKDFLSDSYRCLKSRGELLILTDAKPTPALDVWKRFPKLLMKKEAREMMRKGLSLDQILLIIHQNKYNVRRYFDCKGISEFESAGFRIKECEQFMGGMLACLFQAYLLVRGLTFTNTAHRLVSLLLNPFVHLARNRSHGVGVYFKCIKRSVRI